MRVPSPILLQAPHSTAVPVRESGGDDRRNAAATLEERPGPTQRAGGRLGQKVDIRTERLVAPGAPDIMEQFWIHPIRIRSCSQGLHAPPQPPPARNGVKDIDQPSQRTPDQPGPPAPAYARPRRLPHRPCRGCSRHNRAAPPPDIGITGVSTAAKTLHPAPETADPRLTSATARVGTARSTSQTRARLQNVASRRHNTCRTYTILSRSLQVVR